MRAVTVGDSADKLARTEGGVTMLADQIDAFNAASDARICVMLTAASVWGMERARAGVKTAQV